MAYDEALAQRIRTLLGGEDDIVEMKMFGGLAFLAAGNMAIAASGTGGLLVRCDPARTDELAAQPHAGRFAMRGREMDGWLRVDGEGARTDEQLESWARIGLEHARSLPPKG